MQNVIFSCENDVKISVLNEKVRNHYIKANFCPFSIAIFSESTATGGAPVGTGGLIF